MARKDYLSDEYTEADKKLIKIFQEEVKKLDLLYFRAINSNNWDKAKEILNKIKEISKVLKANYEEWADYEIPKEYLKGATYIDDTIEWWDSLGIVLEADKKEIRNMIKSMWPAHLEAVNALLNTSKNYVKSSLDWMERQAITMLSELEWEKVREELARWTLLGENLADMKERIKRYFVNNKISWFKDRAWRIWSMDRYVDMLTRTETSIANVQGTINRAIQLWHTKFKVVEAPDCCDYCADENGKVVDIAKGTVDLPPFHPNCRWYIVVVLDNWEEVANNKDEDKVEKINRTPEERVEKAFDIVENSTMYLDWEQCAIIDIETWDIMRVYTWDEWSVQHHKYESPHILTHNHPNWSSFSDTDIDTWSMDRWQYWMRASWKIWVYYLYWEKFWDKLYFARKYSEYEKEARIKANEDLSKIAYSWGEDYVHLVSNVRQGTFLRRKDDPLRLDKIFDEHYWKYFREALYKAANDSPWVEFKFIPNDWVEGKTELHDMYKEMVEEVHKLKEEDNKDYYLDVGSDVWLNYLDDSY